MNPIIMNGHTEQPAKEDVFYDTITNNINIWDGTTWDDVTSTVEMPSTITIGETTFTEKELKALKKLLQKEYPECYL